MLRRTGLTPKDVEHYLEDDFLSGSELDFDDDDSDKDPNYENEFILDYSDSDFDIDDSNNENDIVLPPISLETSIVSTST